MSANAIVSAIEVSAVAGDITVEGDNVAGATLKVGPLRLGLNEDALQELAQGIEAIR